MSDGGPSVLLALILSEEGAERSRRYFQSLDESAIS